MRALSTENEDESQSRSISNHITSSDDVVGSEIPVIAYATSFQPQVDKSGIEFPLNVWQFER